MIRLIIGGVTLAAIGYVTKEYCNDTGCPWEAKRNRYSDDESHIEESVKSIENSDMAKEFHKYKKYIYNLSMKGYENFLKKHNIENSEIIIDIKLTKQKFTQEQISEELESYITQISSTLEILSNNLLLSIQEVQNQTTLEDETIQKLGNYADSIYALSHLNLFTIEELNSIEILSTLLKAMALTTVKIPIHVELDVA